MTKYIDKDALVAEINKIKEMYCYDQKTNASFVAEAVINSINNAIDTLEVKEVDLKEELANYNMEYVDENGFFNTEHFAEYFFELGIKAQKGDKV